MTRPNKILVTGSSGFIGKYFINKLKSENIEFVECDLALGTDILDLDAVLALPPVDTVVHLAANTNVQEAFKNPYGLYHDNILGTLNVLEYCRQKKVKRIVFSSSYVYGKPQYLPVDEKHPIEIDNPYGRSKLIGESLVSAFSKDNNMDAVILRNFNIFGAHQNSRFLIATILDQLFSDAKEISLKDLSPKRDFIYIKDIIDAFFVSCQLESLKGINIFNLGIGQSYSVEEVLALVFKVSGVRKPVVGLGVSRRNEIPDTVADIKQAKEQLGWQPSFTFEEGLKDMLKIEGRI
ncbi:MAG: GDP-mannose 4,6-dehydratase [Candidatus Margulisbacteria bacterium]|nr:GDP-mannose 4,6-dehydratase [Candidatus Margulisiibacteriota bacterium]MBU1022111.1 GDP-mannose 4,6-dehydratase [Candidatus Margulisiibacteriota bacterium]MBU1728627.1 GDP-mannose 4,6-dehydratase [Candidatus Margulisiibacteriota bacterium]MBU1955078.1 GDP-mannose 4,6-dehydratase [Candidatus Margulisiibacteriota bacterium]